jgi:hypothetical protein
MLACYLVIYCTVPFSAACQFCRALPRAPFGCRACGWYRYTALSSLSPCYITIYERLYKWSERQHYVLLLSLLV